MHEVKTRPARCSALRPWSASRSRGSAPEDQRPWEPEPMTTSETESRCCTPTGGAHEREDGKACGCRIAARRRRNRHIL